MQQKPDTSIVIEGHRQGTFGLALMHLRPRSYIVVDPLHPTSAGHGIRKETVRKGLAGRLLQRDVGQAGAVFLGALKHGFGDVYTAH